MAGSRTAGWVIGTAVLVLAVLAGTWFFLASPRFEAAAETMLEVENSRTQNDLLEIKNAQLKADFAKLEEYRAEVATLQKQIPATAELPAYARTIADLAEANGVTLLDVSPGTAMTVVIPTPPAAAPAPAPAEGTTPEGADDEVSTESETGTIADAQLGSGQPVPTGPTAPDGLVAVPYTVRVLGTYEATNAFLAALQTGTDRLFLVTTVDEIRQQEAEATASKPAVADGDVELSVTGYTYVLPDSVLAVAPPAEDAEEPAPAPLPSTTRNPFAPLG